MRPLFDEEDILVDAAGASDQIELIGTRTSGAIASIHVHRIAGLRTPLEFNHKWPELTSLEGAPAYNVGRTYAAFASDIDNGTHTGPDFADAVRRHEVTDAIERSAASGRRVKAYSLPGDAATAYAPAPFPRARQPLSRSSDQYVPF